MFPDRFNSLADRLKWAPSLGTVPGSLPVLFFGDLANATVATVGINPSRQEYLSSRGVELDGEQRRFETLNSLGLPGRGDIRAPHVIKAVGRMTNYFGQGRPVYGWFQPLIRVVEGFETSFVSGGAAHLDLVQEATDSVWSGLHKSNPIAANALLARDLAFLRWEIMHFPLRTLICTSATVLRHVLPMVDARVEKQGTLARVKWTIARGRVGERAVSVVGWNIPLLRPTGLSKEDQTTLGAVLRSELNALTEA